MMSVACSMPKASSIASEASAAGLLALLQESHVPLKSYAIAMLSQIVDQAWPEIADALPILEELYEDETFPERHLAALLLAKVYFHLGAYEDSLNYALLANELFVVGESSEFVQTILAKAIDEYVKTRISLTEEAVRPELQAIVERLVKQCFEDGEIRQAIGIAIESRRIDILEAALKRASPIELFLHYTKELVLSLLPNGDFRVKVLRLLICLFEEQAESDFISIADCLVFIRDANKCASLLKHLIGSESEPAKLQAYQIGFDLVDNAPSAFLNSIILQLADSDKTKESKSNDLIASSANGRLLSILTGEVTARLCIEFLYRSNHADLLILEQSKERMNMRNSMQHSAITYANAIMHAGTTNDEFLRKNLEWLSYATNWSKFSAAAGLGVLHRGQLQNGKAILEPYLPKEGLTSSPYSEGGSLFALGLIQANTLYKQQDTIEFALKHLKSSQSEVVQHGACLGLGAAALASEHTEVTSQVKAILFGDNAVAGEAAGIALGLLWAGTGSEELVSEMIQYASETQHEKVIRGLSVGLALIMYGLCEQAEPVIGTLTMHKDPIIRYGGVWTTALAYAGTSNNSAVRRLLHLAVSEANDDVRRASVMGLGLVLFRSPAELPGLLELLAESYNPHVRYGVAIALGLAFAGTGSYEAISLIRPMTKDLIDFVRQGAFIALAMILMQQNEASCSEVGPTRQLFESVISNRHEDATAKFGAILAQGIIDAGGRNSLISLMSPSGHTSMTGVIGVALFCQFWYWYPMIHFLSISLTPTALIGVDSQLELPDFEVICNAKPSLFEYPPAIKSSAETAPKKLATAVLSTTAKAKARAKKGKKEAMEVDDNKVDICSEKGSMAESVATISAELKPEGEIEKNQDESKASPEAHVMDVDAPKPKGDAEPTLFLVRNLTRITPSQLSLVAFPADSRYVSVTASHAWKGGIVLLQDRRPQDKRNLIDQTGIPLTKAVLTTEAGETTEEPAPPEPFPYPEDI